MFEAIGAYALMLAKKQAVKKAAKWPLALLPVLVVLVLVGSMFMSMMFVSMQDSATAAASSNSNGCGTVAVPVGVTNPGMNLDAQQLANAATIIAVGKQLNVPASGWAVAIATALQESGMMALNYGDRDSLGIFQQRAAWGTVAQRMDVATSAAMFYQGGHAGSSNGGRGHGGR